MCSTWDNLITLAARWRPLDLWMLLGLLMQMQESSNNLFYRSHLIPNMGLCIELEWFNLKVIHVCLYGTNTQRVGSEVNTYFIKDYTIMIAFSELVVVHLFFRRGRLRQHGRIVLTPCTSSQ